MAALALNANLGPTLLALIPSPAVAQVTINSPTPSYTVGSGTLISGSHTGLSNTSSIGTLTNSGSIHGGRSAIVSTGRSVF